MATAERRREARRRRILANADDRLQSLREVKSPRELDNNDSHQDIFDFDNNSKNLSQNENVCHRDDSHMEENIDNSESQDVTKEFLQNDDFKPIQTTSYDSILSQHVTDGIAPLEINTNCAENFSANEANTTADVKNRHDSRVDNGIEERKDEPSSRDRKSSDSQRSNEKLFKRQSSRSSDVSDTLPKNESDIQENQNLEVLSPMQRTVRLLVVIFLALILFGRWFYVTEIMHITSEVYESMIWPFSALQLAFLCFSQYRKVYHSSTISLVSVVLHLSGLPQNFIYSMNFFLTTFAFILQDFSIYLFTIVLLHSGFVYLKEREMIL